jgi:putative transcriptional regulator
MSSSHFLTRVTRMLHSKNASNTPEASTCAIHLPNAIPAPHIMDATESNGYLKGQLLVATPLIDSGCFEKSVVYIFAHSHEGAMGLIINQPLDTVDMRSLTQELDISAANPDGLIQIYHGGPVEQSRGFVLHSNDYQKDFTLSAHQDICVTASSAILEDIAHEVGPRHNVLIVGSAGWAPGQLEQEIEQNSWIHVPATPELLFETDDAFKWVMASKSLGVDMNFYSTAIGHA